MSRGEREATPAQMRDLLTAADGARNEMVLFLQDLLRIPSVNHGSRRDTGNESRVCECIGDKLVAEGILTEVHESAPGRGNLIARFGDAAGQRRLLLLSHTDVVPVEEESEWVHPPFSGVAAGECVHGRGSDDDKGDVATQAMALLLLRRAGLRLGGELICLAAADEESGGRYGAGWVADNLPDRIRADYAINEGSGIPVQYAGGVAYPICNGEKGRYELDLRVRGISGHAARPWTAKNPLGELAGAIRRIAEYDARVDLTHPCYMALGELLAIPRGIDAEMIERLPEMLPGSEILANTLKASSRMTIVPTMVRSGIKSNSIPATASLTCDVRTLPGQNADYVAAEVERILGSMEAERDLRCTADSTASPIDSPFVPLCHSALEMALGRRVQLLPMLTTGFTDSRFARALGVQTYGFTPYVPSVCGERTGIHGVDEYIEVETLMLRLKMVLALACLSLGLASHRA